MGLALSKHWNIREHIKDFRSGKGEGREARYVVLDYLILRANMRLRTHVGVETIMEDCGYNSKHPVSGAIQWLFEHGAIYNVPHKHRVGKEALLSPRKYVFQLTGVIRLNGKVIPYLLMDDTLKAEVVEELEKFGAEHAVNMLEEHEVGLSPERAESAPSKVQESAPSKVRESAPKGLPVEGLPDKEASTSGDADAPASDDDVFVDAYFRKQEKPQPPHPLIATIIECSNKKSLSEAQLRDLNAPVRQYDYEKRRLVETHNNYLERWDSDPDWQKFLLEEAFPYMDVKAKGKPTPRALIGTLDNNRWYRDWRKKNDLLDEVRGKHGTVGEARFEGTGERISVDYDELGEDADGVL